MHKIFRAIMTGATWVSDFFVNVLGSFLVVTLMLLISGGAISRYVFGAAQGWITEVSAYSMLVLAFLGTAQVLKRHSHVNIDIFLNMLTARKRGFVNFITSIFGMILTACLCWFSIESTFDAYAENAMLVGMVEIPRFYLMAFMPVGFLLLTIFFVSHIFSYYNVFTGKASDEEHSSVRH